MGKFRDFIINEEIGLGELGSRIDSLFHSQRFGNQIAGALVSSSQSGTGEVQPNMGYQGHPTHMPATDLTIPSVERSGRITILQPKKNPIYVRLSDGTEAYFTYDEYKRIEGTPGVGKVMRITFQRHPEDTTRMYSKVDKAIVTD